jgi:hypothetical protein
LIDDCRATIVGLRISIPFSHDDFVFLRKKFFNGGFVKYMALFGEYIVEMFEQLGGESRKRLVVYCCNGSHCHGDDPESKVYFQVVLGEPMDDTLVGWLKLGRDEEYVMNPDPPSNDATHWRVIEML